VRPEDAAVTLTLDIFAAWRRAHFTQRTATADDAAREAERLRLGAITASAL
jgi:hypothetical protein